MSVVKKLIIQGVRSFSPSDNKSQMIEFQTPLTIILGVNGSGKTTIIEALKYAITNQFPPNCLKGSSFVNDPKLTNGYDAMAVVKLEVTDSRESRIFTTRRVKVTVKDKQGNLTMKQLDSTIRIADVKGNIKEISNKCSDTKVEMCRLMGVSEAILNHVILCHQEDSCWPLDEAKKVKEKFDSIFNTTMYIKCLDQLGKQDKELGIKLKLENTKFQYVIENRKIAWRKKKDVNEKEIQLKSVSDDIAKDENDLKEMETKLRDLEKLERDYNEVANQVSEAKGRMEIAEKQVTELKSNIKEEFDGDIPSLQQFMKNFSQAQHANDQQLKKLLQEGKEKEEELRKLNVQQKTFILEDGKYQQEKNTNDKRTASVTAYIIDIAEMVKKLKASSQDTSFSNSMDACIEVCEGDPNDLSTDTVIRALAAAVRARDSEMTKTKTQYEKEEKDIQSSIDELRTKRASLEKEIEMKKKQIGENKISVVEIKSRLRSIEGSNETLALLGDDEQKYVEQIETIQKSGVLDKCETDIKALTRDLKELEKEISQASDNVELLNKDEKKLDQIAIFNRQKMQKQSDSNEIMRRIEEDLSTLLGDIPENDIGKAVEKKRESLAKELNAKKGEQKQKERELTVSETELKRVRSDLEKREAKVEGWKAQIDELIEDKNFDDVYEELTLNLEKSQKASYHNVTASYLYKTYIRKLNKKDCCPLCKRDMESKQKAKQLIAEIEKDVEKMEQNEPVEKALVEKLKKKQQELINFKPIWEENQKLEKDEIPSLKKKKLDLETKTNDLKETIDDLNGLVAILDNEHSTAVKCSKEVSFYEQAKKEVKKHEASIASIEATRDPKAKVLQNTLNLSDAKTLLQDLRGSVSAKQIEKDNKADMLNKKRNELTKCQDEKNKVREDILRITAELQNREALEVQKKELEETNKQLQEAVVELNTSLPSSKTDISEAEKRKLNCIDRKEAHLNGLRVEKDGLEKQKSKLLELNKQIEEFEQKKGRFADIQKRSMECKKKIEEAEKLKNKLSKEIDAVKQAISSQEMKQRNLQDNLQYKKRIEEIGKLKAELSEKEKLFQSTQNRGVSIQRREVGVKYHKLSNKMNQLQGSRKEMIVAINELKRELNEKPLNNVEEEYTEKLVKKTIYEKAQRDIRRYKTALDNAIMKFHSKRMEMINQILWDYWRTIYKGNDIDAIQIRTETAGSKAAPGTGQIVKVETGARTRKNYNYRVVMIRRGIELDMRGRCSAGQRVLASIIIRIALAESFSARCGIITLDEPTTNLDIKNINSLADALSSLAERMASRNNFQLIVITHDQEFTERLSAVDSVEKYWKVTRDNMGFSQIEMKLKRG